MNSDNPPFFETSLSGEYAFAADAVQDFTEGELPAAARTAIEAAFVDAPTCERLERRFTREALALGAAGAGD